MTNFEEAKKELKLKLEGYLDFNKLEESASFGVYKFKLNQENYRICFAKTSLTGTERAKPQIRVFWEKIKEHASESKARNEKFFCAIHCSTPHTDLRYNEDFKYSKYIVFLESDFNVERVRIDTRAIYDELRESFGDGTKNYIKIIVPDDRNTIVRYASVFNLDNLDRIDEYFYYYDNRISNTFSEKTVDDMEKVDANTRNEIDTSAKSVLYTGAPGTGKSYQLNVDSSKFKDKKERITFYPTLTYGQFIGVYKPFPDGKGITYRYIAGPLIKQLIKALTDEENNYLLIIEELNRGDASAIFGDTFQLFDRNQNGESEYPIHISYDLEYYLKNEVYPKYSEEQIETLKSKLKNGLIFPSNFYIWATMNNADQGVLPIDTAFTRRWDRNINIGIDDAFNNNKETFNSYHKIEVVIDRNTGNKGLISWNDIRQFINDQLTKMRVAEDKLLGPYFISRNILESSHENVTESFKDKVLSYLVEDAIKHKSTSFFTLSERRPMYSEVVKSFNENGIKIFNEYEKINDCINPIHVHKE